MCKWNMDVNEMVDDIVEYNKSMAFKIIDFFETNVVFWFLKMYEFSNALWVLILGIHFILTFDQLIL